MIGIMNFYKADNFGAVLQCYALQQTIELMGEKSEVVNYECKYITKHYKLLHTTSLTQLASDMVYLFDHFLKKKEFEKFRLKYLTVSKQEYNRNTIYNTNQIYDIFITGSDQVFNYKCSGFDYSFFLDFVCENNDKCAYGASYGFSEIPIAYKKKYRELLQDFKYLSFRENVGVEITEELLARKTLNVIDPTLLAPKKVWDFDCPIKYKRYILVYMLERSNTLLNFTKNLSKKTGLEVIYIGSLVRGHRNGLKAKFLGHESPEEFVCLFKNAEYVVTNSFHGTAFSIIFHRQFFTEMLQHGGETNNRFTSLLEQLGLVERIMNSENAECIIDRKIDYEDVEMRLDDLRRASADYLKKICTATREE